MKYEIGVYDLCPCGSGKKYKFCCAGNGKEYRRGRYPLGTVVLYGPDDKTTTKIAACVIRHEFDNAEIIERWVGTNVLEDPKVFDEIKRFFARHGVANVVSSDANFGCPHEEGPDFPVGQDCPFCPFWAGKQGTARRKGGLKNEQIQIAQGEHEKELARDYDAIFARVNAIIGSDADDLDREAAMDRLFAHLQANLQLPCEVTGTEDFQWEERYVIGGWDPREYKQLKKAQPSYTDRYQLLGIERKAQSKWMMCPDDIAARVQRIGDGKIFVLGLCELELVDESSPNVRLLEDYSVWFANSR
jgi:hypothetical protein